MRLATDKTVCLSLWGQAPLVNKLTFSIRASDSSWHPGLPGRPLFHARRSERIDGGPRARSLPICRSDIAARSPLALGRLHTPPQTSTTVFAARQPRAATTVLPPARPGGGYPGRSEGSAGGPRAHARCRAAGPSRSISVHQGQRTPPPTSGRLHAPPSPATTVCVWSSLSLALSLPLSPPSPTTPTK